MIVIKCNVRIEKCTDKEGQGGDNNAYETTEGIVNGKFEENKIYRRCRMKRNNVLATIVISFIFVCLMVSSAVSQEKVWRLKYWSAFNEAQFEGKIEMRFFESVKTSTGGRVTITPFWNASLASRPEALRALENGVFEIAAMSCPDSPGQFPVSDIASLPFLFKNSEEALNALTALYKKGLMPEYNKFKLGTLLMTDMQYIAFVKKEVNNLEDIKGLKVRVSPGIASETLNALGATPVGMNANEVYMAANRGVVDGFVTSSARMYETKLYEVAKVVIDLPAWVGIRFLGVNLNTWNSFPDDIKAIMEKEFAKMSKEWLQENTDTERTSKEMLRAKGMKFITLGPAETARWKQATQPVEAAFVKKLNGLGIQGQKAVDEAKANIKR
jgi:TRAP-type transport system periplasmic protein